MSVKVSNLESTRSGNPVANQFIISIHGHDYFQSYDSIIVDIDYTAAERIVTLDKRYWDYSVTTSKYRNQFLRENKKETQAKIDSGEYKLANLN